MSSKVQQRAQEIRQEKIKVYEIRGPHGYARIEMAIQSLGATKVTLKTSKLYAEEADFNDWSSARDHVIDEIVHLIREAII